MLNILKFSNLNNSVLGLVAGLCLGLSPTFAGTRPLPPLTEDTDIGPTLL